MWFVVRFMRGIFRFQLRAQIDYGLLRASFGPRISPAAGHSTMSCTAAWIVRIAKLKPTVVVL